MLELKVFQSESAKLIADRYALFATHPDRPRKGSKPRPFFQALSALTGAGKTPILAQAVALLRLQLPTEPIVLWMSKAKSVVAQTHANFSGGKYSGLIEGFEVINVQDLSPKLIEDGTTPLLVMTTTGLFNNKEQAAGTLNIYKTDNDQFGDRSPWDRLIQRRHGNVRRPLIVVYDEGHNLSEQQTELLAELEPEAYLLASATMKLPSSFHKSVLQHIALWVEEANAASAFATLKATDSEGKPSAELFTTTTVPSGKVVEAQLVKRALQFDGTTAAMERSIDDLIERRQILLQEIAVRQLSIVPKAIYVCKTNVTDDGDKDDASKPFDQREAPPIRIWRYLVHAKGVPPSDIAIYANLSFVEGNKPEEVHLFSKGENDFETFTAGDYKHIIFNLSLQEGWDDPSCYLAYIDRSMGSSIQVEQVIGRVLRQPSATHYDNPLLNSAHLFLRVDSKNVFAEAIERVKSKLQAEGAPIEITHNFGTSASFEYLQPKPTAKVGLHHVYVDGEQAREHIGELLDQFPTWAAGDPNTIGQAHTIREVVDVTGDVDRAGGGAWTPDGTTNAVRLRWLISSAVKARSLRALSVVDLKDAKFDVRVQVHSIADKLAQKLAEDIVATFYQHAELVYEENEPFEFGALRVPKTAPAFANALYDRYGGLNKLELPFAKALDAAEVTWHRNPSAGGFSIPLLSEGETSRFYPDFIVWRKGKVFCLDTKGSHLLSDAVVRKLFDIKDDAKVKIHTRFISEGKQTELRGKALKGGFTVWRSKLGAPLAVHVDSLDKAVKECLR